LYILFKFAKIGIATNFQYLKFIICFLGKQQFIIYIDIGGKLAYETPKNTHLPIHSSGYPRLGANFK
jgi:hypothetical protein